jgi:hypothetical protein
VDSKEVATKKMPHTIPFLMSIDETFDIGSDTPGGRQGLSGAVPLHRQARQGDLQTGRELTIVGLLAMSAAGGG